MTAGFQISLTYVHVINLRLLQVKNINANGTQFPRAVCDLGLKLHYSKKVPKLKHIFHSGSGLTSVFSLIVTAICLQTRSLGSCDRAHSHTKTLGSNSTEGMNYTSFSMLFDTCGPCDGLIICQKRPGIACLRIYNLALFLNRKMLEDPIRLELRRETNRYMT
jgi:hypothetical protein